MGADFLAGYGYDTIRKAAASNPEEQSYLQMFAKDQLYKITQNLIIDLFRSGAEAALIYCNSLSCALNLERLREESPIPVITPLEAYAAIVKKYNFIGILAANGQSLHGLEEVCFHAKPGVRLVGASILPIVEAVERETSPAVIVHNNGIAGIAKGFEDAGAQCLILGCTHFPYFGAELSVNLRIPVYNPAVTMIEILKEKLKLK